ncbi:hypothetical protein FE257_006920 [Aspergillus nanangensis]|uniref:Zn(2)-C6 fungal-type domain-containing protein n=1 Tax=Aspergillus nanangensis TaxID=2582783 RepID=A0AAD4CNM7_ASPNN|nr:hypothetical protein FE257_006920 [Aspergillus nanangensis]
METNSRRVPPDKRKRTEMSCDKCKPRKQKCDRQLGQPQCRYCQLNGFVCSTTQPRKQRIYANDEDLRSRLDLLESLVKGLLPEADLSSNAGLQHLGKSLGIPMPITAALPKCHQGNEKQDVDAAASLLPDQQGQVQYIGPLSSFAFHNKLRTLMGSYTSREFAMFGHNAADATRDTTDSAKPIAQIMTTRHETKATSSTDYRSILQAASGGDGTILNSLVDTYFDIIHPDFPVLHEASFREEYELWISPSASVATNPVWTCSLLCLLNLSRRVSSVPISSDTEQRWWSQAQTLLPTVLFTTNIHTIQALLLAALHLHNTNHRDACWTLTGAALHVAVAMGLHRADLKQVHSPLQREVRKQLWWTLYAFEKMQVSSYDRPSGLGDAISSAGVPNERIVGFAGHYPQELMRWSHQLVALLDAACKALGTTNRADLEGYALPLSPVSTVLRDLARWKESLPGHLRMEGCDALAPASRRPVLLLHAQCCYVTVLVSKAALLRRATVLSTGLTAGDDVSETVRAVSKTCIEAGRSLGDLMRKMDGIGKFNPFTWWDTFYTMISALVLALDILCCARQGMDGEVVQSEELLQGLKILIQRHIEHPMVPGSMRAWGTIVVDLARLATQFTPASSGSPGSGGYIGGLSNGASLSPIEAITLEHFNLLHTSFDIVGSR